MFSFLNVVIKLADLKAPTLCNITLNKKLFKAENSFSFFYSRRKKDKVNIKVNTTKDMRKHCFSLCTFKERKSAKSCLSVFCALNKKRIINVSGECLVYNNNMKIKYN